MNRRRTWLLPIICIVALATATTSASAQEPVEPESTPQSKISVHVVQRGETLFRIAQQYGVTVETLAATNNILDPTRIEIGQRLIIPGPAAEQAQPGATIIAQPSDSFQTLLLRLGSSVEQLAGRNFIVRPEMVFAGQPLVVVTDSQGAQPITNGVFDYVQPGDTASRIAARNHVRLTKLLRANRLSSPTELYTGRKLLVPGEGPPLSALSEPWTAITINPLPAQQGRTIALKVETSQPGSLAGRFLSHDLRFVSEAQSNIAIIGIHALTRPAVYPLELTFTTPDGQSSTFTRGVLVDTGGYGQETIDVPSGLEGLLDNTLLDGEFLTVSQKMGGFTLERLWNGLFLLPSGGDVASAYGTRRVYSGFGIELKDRFHSGADIAMPLASPILAPARGRVVFVGSLEVRGNATIIEHGWGVYSGYWHQAGILVQTGQVVEAGQQIGTVGNTGLTTGPHLHWEMWVSGVQVDPLQWVRQTLP